MAQVLLEPATGPEAQLDELFRESVAAVRARERSAFDEEAGPYGNNLVLFGAGNLGRRVLARLRQDGIEPRAFADNNPARWGGRVDGLAVLAPSDAARRFGGDCAFVVTIWSETAKQRFVRTRHQLTALGCYKVLPVSPLRWKYHDTFLPFLWEDLPHKVYEQAAAVRDALGLWADVSSRREYVAQVRWRALGDFDGLAAPTPHESYFPEDVFRLADDEAFVDCGAYDGDTVRTFLHRRGDAFRSLTALEPDPATYARLVAYLDTLPGRVRGRITALPVAVGAAAGRVTFDAGGSAAVSEAGDVEVTCARLDDLLAGRPVTYVKMDIEGAEADAVAGAAGAIAGQRPVLAVCVYHRQDHLWRLPRLVHSIAPDYRFFLRPHENDGWQLVCYAVPAERLGR